MNEIPKAPGNEGTAIDVEKDIASLTAEIAEARARIAGGQNVDLAELSDKVGEFCAAVAVNPPADAEAATAMIETLVKDLDGLASVLDKQNRDRAPDGGGGA
ncbi:MAG: hypothetical protein IIC56_04425 [Proteobacteria bacterium]|nr:hypothetical protein [Pseudomonadota bacterium]